MYEILDNQAFSTARAGARMADGIGQITRLAGASSLGPAETAQLANQIQRYLVEETRLRIPAMAHEECCTGYVARGATSFPQAIGLASTWEPELARQMTEVIRTQMRAVGAHQGLAPVLDINRDPRWGRVEETFGEDPYLAASVGVAYIQGLQGDDLSQGVVATGKHFVGYGMPLGGLNWAPVFIPPRELAEVYLLPFEAAVREAGLASMMAAYHELDGIPCHSSRELLTGILSDRWSFDGLVVADYMGTNMLADYHHLAKDKVEAGRLALEAGMDVELPSIDCFGQPLLEAVRSGAISQPTVDQAVRRMLRMKFTLGLFENPYVKPDEAIAVFDTPQQRNLARTIAHKSMVLLKNEDDLLPLSREIGSIAVIGPNADNLRNLVGDYSYPAHIDILVAMNGMGLTDTPLPDSLALADNFVPISSILAAIQEQVSSRTQVHYAQGCGVLDPSTAGFAEAVRLATQADVAVVVVGDKSGLTTDCSTGEFRDRAELGLPGIQEEMVRDVWATGTPVVVVLTNGRPFAIPWIAEHVPAILEAWFPGEEGAQAIADTLFGTNNPGGKLPITIPRSVGQVPIYYGHKPSGARSFLYGPYVDLSNEPLYPFGHGLSYTRFELSNLMVTPRQVTADGQVEVAVDVANVGERSGDEVVQRGIKRLALAAGERTTVTGYISKW